MNIEYARTINLRTILYKIGYRPYNQVNEFLFYRAIFGVETAYHLKVNTFDNTWLAVSGSTSGNGVDLVRLYLKHAGQQQTISAALKWLKHNIGYATLDNPPGTIDWSLVDQDFSVKDEDYLFEPALIRYLEEERCIPFDYARILLKQVCIENGNSKNQFMALGIKNEDGGFAIRNAFIKANVGKQNITVIRGSMIKPDYVHVFKDAIDYLSILTIREGRSLSGDAIITNGFSQFKKIAPYIRGYGYKRLYSWLDNSGIGNRATRLLQKFAKAEDELNFIQMNFKYKPFKDVNDWHVNNSISS